MEASYSPTKFFHLKFKFLEVSIGQTLQCRVSSRALALSIE